MYGRIAPFMVLGEHGGVVQIRVDWEAEKTGSRVRDTLQIASLMTFLPWEATFPKDSKASPNSTYD